MWILLLFCPRKLLRSQVRATELIHIFSYFFFPKSSRIQCQRLFVGIACRRRKWRMLFSKEVSKPNVCSSFPLPLLLTLLFLLRANVSLTQTTSPMTGHVCKSSRVMGTHIVWWQKRGCDYCHEEKWTFLWSSLPHCSLQGTGGSRQGETSPLVFIPPGQNQEISWSQF